MLILKSIDLSKKVLNQYNRNSKESWYTIHAELCRKSVPSPRSKVAKDNTSQLKMKSSEYYPTTPWNSKDVIILGFSDPMEIFLRFITPMYRSEESA